MSRDCFPCRAAGADAFSSEQIVGSERWKERGWRSSAFCRTQFGRFLPRSSLRSRILALLDAFCSSWLSLRFFVSLHARLEASERDANQRGDSISPPSCYVKAEPR